MRKLSSRGSLHRLGALGRRVLTGPGVALFVASGCARLQPPLPERELASGATVTSLVANADTAVVLLYKPSDSFVCNGSLQPWLQWRHTHPRAFALVFTREPTRAERTQLMTHRIHADGILRRRLLDGVFAPPAPAELLLVRGRVVSITAIWPRMLTTPLYRRLNADGS